jgi:hypothetical protein
MLIGWSCVAAVLLVISLVVHASTFLGVDPIVKWPGVMWMQVAIFAPFVAAIYYARRIGGTEQSRGDQVLESAPLWLRILTGLFFAYMFVNFAAFVILSEGGSPDERGGKFFLKSHGTVLRELSAAEFHTQQAYVARGFSGHWMLFSSAALTILAGTARLRRRDAAGEAASAQVVVDSDEQPQPSRDAASPPEPTSASAGLVSLVVYSACVAMILSSQPALSMAAVLPVMIATVLAIRRRRGFPHGPFESRIGCLTVFPNAFIAARMGRMVAEFIYIAIYAGISAALSHGVAVQFPREGPAQLTNGELLNNRVWSALMLFVEFPLFGVGTIGLTYLAEHLGRLVEVRRSLKPKLPQVE